ncbi:MAG: stage II sporulation protein D [Vulcanibacillus sp.]
MKKVILIFIIILATSMISIPIIFVTIFDDDRAPTVRNQNIELKQDIQKYIQINIYRDKTKKIETYSLEEYIRGVVAAEMPSDFEIEALKAQAIASRTYIVKKIINKEFTDVPDGAMVTDTVKHQVFLSEEELISMWGLDYPDKISKINQAVNETNGQVIVYQGKPIDALFFSTSNGYTENSEDYWLREVSYLRSVTSPWDLQSPKYFGSTKIPFSEIENKLNIDNSVMVSSAQKWIEILETTEGRSVKQIKIGDKTMTGREVRETFNLNSSTFTVEITDKEVIFSTRGYGHGVGMSQYGADGMAKEGKTALEIVKYYYTGVDIKNIDEWIKPV